jgi:hypothetical protein
LPDLSIEPFIEDAHQLAQVLVDESPHTLYGYAAAAPSTRGCSLSEPGTLIMLPTWS